RACPLLNLRSQVSPDQAGIRLADLDERLPRSIVRDGDDIEALVRNAVTQQRNVQHNGRGSVHALHDRRLKARERSYVADAVPGIQPAWRLALCLVPLEKAR